VPIDPAYPVDRIAFMLSDANPTVVLTQEKLRRSLPPSGARVIVLDSEWPQIAVHSKEPFARPATGADVRRLAYVIYTSGSTGIPKGVQVEHATFCNLTYVKRAVFALGASDRVLQFSSISFDACVWESMTALGSGAALCLASREEIAPGEPLLRTLSEMKITYVVLPPVALSALPVDREIPLRTLVVGGDVCQPAMVEQWGRDRRFVNAYGPTEATVCTTLHECLPGEQPVPIGEPIANTQVYLLDPTGQPVPIGVVGEVFIAGAGVARGYLNRPELTAQRFVANPFGGDVGGRLYRTGDLGRWRKDGAIEYQGRNDGQIKLRGFRIELGEIEVQLMRHPAVRDAVVIIREVPSGEKQLVAYFVHGDQTPDLDGLRRHLQGVLPGYMIPSAFVAMDSWPTTPNGKLNRCALPAPDITAFVRREYEPPQGAIEEMLVQAWREVLRLERVSRQDHFFELGGHSVAAMHVGIRIQSALNVEVPMRLVLEYPILAQLAAQLEEQVRDSLAAEFDQGDDEMRGMLEQVASMPDQEVDELMRRLAAGERP
jgi:amino acid adenylation domain-containing protein